MIIKDNPFKHKPHRFESHPDTVVEAKDESEDSSFDSDSNDSFSNQGEVVPGNNAAPSELVHDLEKNASR